MKKLLSLVLALVLLCTSSVYFAAGAEEAHVHTKGDLVSQLLPTCSAAGLEVYECSVCGENFEVVLPEVPHTHAEGAIPSDSQAATCTATGWKEYTCAACGDPYKEEIPMAAHDVTVTVTEATCEAPKTFVSKCKNCDYTKTVTEGDALGHLFTDDPDLAAKCAAEGLCPVPERDLLVHTHKDATCAEAGFDGDAYYCVRCGIYKDNVITVIEKKAHENKAGDPFYDLLVVDASTPSKTEIPATNEHGKITRDYKAPTCTEAGSVTVSCDLCGLTETREIKALGHLWHDKEGVDWDPTKEDWWPYWDGRYDDAVVSWPNCLLNGLVEFTCERCGEAYHVELPARGHHTFDHDDCYREYWQKKFLDRELTYYGCNWDNDVDVAECMDYIVKTECYYCWEVEEQTIKGTGKHDWKVNIVSKEATCTEKGQALFECKDCKTPEFRETKALGHAWDKGTVTKAPTCTEDGVRTYKCTRSGCKETKTEVIPTAGHTKIKVDEKAATCTADGYHKETCLACGAIVKDEVIPAHHTFDPTKVDAITEPTCTKDGFVNYTCTICCAVVEHEVLPALGHDMVDEPIVPATCTSKEKHVSKCSRPGCGYTETVFVGEPLPHDIDHATTKIIYKQETCEEDGLAYYECGDCHKMFEGIIPATGHNFVTTWDAASKSWVSKCVNPGCGKIVTITFKTPSYSIDTSGVTMTSSKTTGSGKIKLDDMCQPLDEAYVRITWSYTLRDGDSLSFVACVPVRADGTFKANGPSAPAGAVLNSVLILVVDNPDADDQSLGSVSKYGDKTLS